MGQIAFILGRSGTGKSYSMRNFSPDEIAVINVQGKILPFKGSAKFNMVHSDKSDAIVEEIQELAKTYKVIVVDDFQYIMANEFMRRATERGFDKFTEIARHAWDVANCVQGLANDVIVYILCHTDTDQDGFEKLKTIGKLLDEKIVLEGMSTIVLKTAVSDGQYMFLTQNSGHDTVKSPAGMFPTYAIDNDLKYVDTKIRNYYEMGEFVPDEKVQELDKEVEKPEIEKPTTEKKKRRSRKSSSTETVVEKTEEKPKRNRTRKETENLEEKLAAEPDPTKEPVDINRIVGDEPEEKPKRRRARKKRDSMEQIEEDAPFL